ncbi:hypothetical protein Pla123a_32400 [Posidoniimonas polymericola]|uniref:HTH-like domain-containing protein n=1 Tax=Posidoniimonas polymericola TaxID=2528002 RepID=A0A5C5YLG6_9BACT|nr:IS3 family transposase [Posidoniimonas polymericola]TWT75730.1 hypothetical protein Pla123a_32400 [Posidoniimonas polymericola]
MAKLREQLGLSERRACRAIGQPRSSQRYESKPRSDEPQLLKRMLQLARRRPRFGYRRIAALLRADDFRASESRILRLWRREGLKVLQKKQKRRRLGVAENGCDRQQATHKNHVWAWDFAFDKTASGTQLKWLSIVDEYTRECVTLKCDRSITSEDVIDRRPRGYEAISNQPWNCSFLGKTRGKPAFAASESLSNRIKDCQVFRYRRP